MKTSTKEFIMESLVTMMVFDRARREARDPVEILREFRKSHTYQNMYDSRTGLWENGPNYLSEEYDDELRKTKIMDDE